MIGRICQREVDLAKLDDNVTTAAERMLQRAVGTLVVIDEERVPVGILTDRDIVLRVVARQKNPTKTLVRDVMTVDIETVTEETPIEEAIAAMKTSTVRRLPVVDPQGRLAGLVSVDDIMLLLAEESTMIGQLLEKETPRQTLND